MPGRDPGRPAPPEPRRAVALRYARAKGDASPAAAPEVVARGRGVVAERMLELAHVHGVAVREDRDLLELLSACELGEQIPVEVWSAVAELLTWVYGLGQAAEPARDRGPGALDSRP